MTPEAMEWHLNGEHGISSRALFDMLHFGKVSERWGHSWPYDPDDFRRCELLLRAVPTLRRRLHEMSEVAPEWGRLVERWDDIVALMEADAPGVFAGRHGRCQRAYDLMASLIRPDR